MPQFPCLKNSPLKCKPSNAELSRRTNAHWEKKWKGLGADESFPRESMTPTPRCRQLFWHDPPPPHAGLRNRFLRWPGKALERQQVPDILGPHWTHSLFQTQSPQILRPQLKGPEDLAPGDAANLLDSKMASSLPGRAGSQTTSPPCSPGTRHPPLFGRLVLASSYWVNLLLLRTPLNASSPCCQSQNTASTGHFCPALPPPI